MSVSSSGRDKSFTVAVIPDTQNYVDHRNQREAGFPINAREMLWDMMDHIARNSSERGGDIVFATGLGDSWQHPIRWGVDAAHAARGLTSAPNPLVERIIPASPREVTEIEIPAVRAAYQILADVLPFSVVPGNHDHDHVWTDSNHPPAPDAWVRGADHSGLGYMHFGSLENWARTFGADTELFDGKPWYVAAFRNGQNSAQRFAGGGYDFLHLGLEMAPDDEVVAWAESVIADHPGLPTIVSIHEFLNPQGERKPIDAIDLSRIDPERNAPQKLWEKFIARHDQILIVLNGHFHGAMHSIDRNRHGHKVYQFLSDYQGRRQSLNAVAPGLATIDGIGDGWLRLMTFDLDADRPRLRLQTYSTHFKAFSRDLPDYAAWYASEHPELSAEDFAALDDFELDLDDFHQRFAKPSRIAAGVAAAAR
ncbi:MAG: serine/threonine protein phosphatase [Pseudomonadota bacterium]|uniref:serine/threonine protein phosphatase n=1 Tax=Phenylobacterium sp. TaxID=1871053 RepID=UPI0025F44567|nr:serine/threonine protein phosphatase [Phenylobacterium sp.]MBT9472706.1 serine/threonine protein phosphatase [Phenylobacterium sp.]